MISPSATNPRRSPSAACGTRSAPAAATISRARSPARTSIKNYKGKKVAIVHDKTTYGQGLADETKKAMNKGGLKEVLYEGVNIGEKDFSALVSKIKASGADLVYWGGLHTEGGLIVRQMRDQGVKAPMMSRRRHHLRRVRHDRRSRRRRHADDLRAGSAQAARGGCRREEVPRQELQARSLHALQLRARAGDGDGGEPRQSPPIRRRSPRRSSGGKPFKTVIGDALVRQEGRHHAAGLHDVHLEEGRGRQDHLRPELSHAA